MPLPAPLRHSLETAFGAPVDAAEVLPGGMINRTARVDLGNERLFVKWNETAPHRLYAAEANGLRALKACGTIRIPEVLDYRDSDAAEVPWLALEWLEPAPPNDSRAFSREFAAQLAALHAAEAGAAFGWSEDNFLGIYPQVNTYTESWPEFYRTNRLAPHLELARKQGYLPPQRAALLHKLIEELDSLLDDMETRPCLIHGDLWSGNFLTTAEGAALLDPAVYYAPREVELAFIELFDGFPPGFVEYYRAISPLPEGYEKRRPVHQLYYLLVHLNYFGEEYGPAVERACVAALGG